MIVLVHVATGGLAGAASGSRARAVLLGPLLHAVFDAIPHEDIPSKRFETASGVAAVLLLARRRGIDAATVGAVARRRPTSSTSSRSRAGGRQLFPTHRWARPVPFRGVPAWLQLAVAVPVVAALARRS